jgi:hypothetical protein
MNDVLPISLPSESLPSPCRNIGSRYPTCSAAISSDHRTCAVSPLFLQHHNHSESSTLHTCWPRICELSLVDTPVVKGRRWFAGNGTQRFCKLVVHGETCGLEGLQVGVFLHPFPLAFLWTLPPPESSFRRGL